MQQEVYRGRVFGAHDHSEGEATGVSFVARGVFQEWRFLKSAANALKSRPFDFAFISAIV
jgi:hypothetical protein